MRKYDHEYATSTKLAAKLGVTLRISGLFYLFLGPPEAGIVLIDEGDGYIGANQRWI